MAEPEFLDPNLAKRATNHRHPEDPYVSELLKGLASDFREMENKNRELEQRNSELLAELQEAKARLAKLEELRPDDGDAGKAAFTMASEILASAEDTVSSIQFAAKAETSSRYEDVTRQVIDVQKEVLALLQRTLDECVRINQEANTRAINVLLESKTSVLSMAESLDRMVLDRMASPRPSLTNRAPSTMRVNDVAPEGRPAGPQRCGSAGKEHHGQHIADAKGESSFDGRSSLASRVAEALQALSASGKGTNRSSPGDEGQDAISRCPREEAEALSNRDEVAWPAMHRAANDSLAEAVSEAPSRETASPTRSMRLVASGLNSFNDLMLFHRAVQQLPGVLAVHAESFRSGAIQLRVRYQSAVQFEEVLSGMAEFGLHQMSSTSDQIDVAVVRR